MLILEGMLLHLYGAFCIHRYGISAQRGIELRLVLKRKLPRSKNTPMIDREAGRRKRMLQMQRNGSSL